jgi:hypothetical protein
MTCPTADMTSCSPKCKCLGGACHDSAYDCSQPCPSGSVFIAAECACEQVCPPCGNVVGCVKTSDPNNLMRINHRPTCSVASGQLISSSAQYITSYFETRLGTEYFVTEYIKALDLGTGIVSERAYLADSQYRNCIVLTPLGFCECPCDDPAA